MGTIERSAVIENAGFAPIGFDGDPGAGTTEIQTITITGAPTAGNFQLGFGPNETGNLDHLISAAALQTALQALPSVGSGNLTVAGINEIQHLAITGTPDGGTFALGFMGQTTTDLAHDAAASDIQAALRLLSTINGANVTVAASSGFNVTFSGTLAGTDVPMLTLDDNSLSGGTVPTVAITEGTKGGSPFTATFAGDLAHEAQDLITLVHNGLSGGSAPSVTIVEQTGGVDAVLRGQPKGTVVIDRTNGKLYINTGTLEAPTWTVVGSQS
jgi:hypothetical protein